MTPESSSLTGGSIQGPVEKSSRLFQYPLTRLRQVLAAARRTSVASCRIFHCGARAFSSCGMQALELLGLVAVM